MTMHEYLLPFQQRLIDQVTVALEEINAGGNSQGILLIGASGSGKTHGLDEVAKQYAPKMEGYQPQRPCCRISVTAQADASATAMTVLQQLGKPITPTARTNLKMLEPDMQAALRARGVRILIFEEFHNAMLAGTPQLRGQLARLIKNIWNLSPQDTPLSWSTPQKERGDSRLVVIVSGTDELYKVFERDTELSSRFGCVIVASSVAFFPPESFRDFRYVFRSLAERFGLSDRLLATDDSTVARCLLACEAHLRKLEKLMQRTASMVRRSDATETIQNLLARAFEEVCGVGGLANNPFRLTEEELAIEVTKARSSQGRGRPRMN